MQSFLQTEASNLNKEIKEIKNNIHSSSSSLSSLSAMSRSQSAAQQPHPKLKPAPRTATLFSCGIFRNCTQSSLSPTTTPPATSSAASPPHPPVLSSSPSPRPPPPPLASSSSSSSSSTSQSFTQWRLPVHQQSPSPAPSPLPETVNPAGHISTLSETYRSAELQFASGAPLQALRLLERALTPDPSPPGPCPPIVMSGVVSALLNSTTARPAAKVLLALVLSEANRAEAVRAGAAEAAVEAVMVSGPAGPTAERGLAALELLCTTADGAAAVRNHQVAAGCLVRAVERMAGRGRECGIGVLAAIYGGEGVEVMEVPPEVVKVVVAAMQGECSVRGRRKGAKLLRVLQETGRLDMAWDGIGGC
ncbi:hypothetical protein LUZ60_003294 [Juncus effusus]|nr:hypothetical protein LUZ60_003294 [Juncus effusus]